MNDVEVIPDEVLEEIFNSLSQEQIEQLKANAGLIVETAMSVFEVLFEKMSEVFGQLADACKEIADKLELDDESYDDINEKVYDRKLIIHLFDNNPSEKVEKIYKWPQPP